MIAWEAEWMKRTVSLGARLASGTESLAGSLAAVKAPSGGNRVLRRAQSNAGEWKIGLQRGSSPYELSLWKKDLRDAAQLHTTSALKNAADTAKEESGYKGVGMPSNAMYMEALKGEQGEAAAWAALLPHKAYDRVMLRRLKMGAIPNLKCNEAKQCKAYNEIEDVELREEVVACDCGEGPQDAWHFWTECCFSELVRKEARLAAEECVMQDGSSTDQAFWAGLSQEQKLVHAVSSRVRMRCMGCRTKAAQCLYWCRFGCKGHRKCRQCTKQSMASGRKAQSACDVLSGSVLLVPDLQCQGGTDFGH